MVYAYIIRLRFVHPQRADEEYTWQGEAYSLNEALTQAFIEIEFEQDLAARGYKCKVKSVRPDIGKDRESLERQINELMTAMRGVSDATQKRE